jgi:hypothetical protein
VHELPPTTAAATAAAVGLLAHSSSSSHSALTSCAAVQLRSCSADNPADVQLAMQWAGDFLAQVFHLPSAPAASQLQEWCCRGCNEASTMCCMTQRQQHQHPQTRQHLCAWLATCLPVATARASRCCTRPLTNVAVATAGRRVSRRGVCMYYMLVALWGILMVLLVASGRLAPATGQDSAAA